MFTGIVEETGEVLDLATPGSAAPPGGAAAPGGSDETTVRLSVRAPLATSDARHGDSISVEGVCLTVADVGDGCFTADVVPETLHRSTLGALRAGDRVNLERAVPAGGRLGGHVVQGHVDGVGRVVERVPGQRWETVRVAVPDRLARYLVEKGSVTVGGVSLTVVDVIDTGPHGPTFSVALIPTTTAGTTLGALPVGAAVNLEVDVLAKYVERLLEAREHGRSRGADADPAADRGVA